MTWKVALVQQVSGVTMGKLMASGSPCRTHGVLTILFSDTDHEPDVTNGTPNSRDFAVH